MYIVLIITIHSLMLYVGVRTGVGGIAISNCAYVEVVVQDACH